MLLHVVAKSTIACSAPALPATDQRVALATAAPRVAVPPRVLVEIAAPPGHGDLGPALHRATPDRLPASALDAKRGRRPPGLLPWSLAALAPRSLSPARVEPVLDHPRAAPGTRARCHLFLDEPLRALLLRHDPLAAAHQHARGRGGVGPLDQGVGDHLGKPRLARDASRHIYYVSGARPGAGDGEDRPRTHRSQTRTSASTSVRQYAKFGPPPDLVGFPEATHRETTTLRNSPPQRLLRGVEPFIASTSPIPRVPLP